jgi:hypothetical protein
MRAILLQTHNALVHCTPCTQSPSPMCVQGLVKEGLVPFAQGLI